MSSEELVGIWMTKFKTAKDTLAQKQAEAAHLADIYAELASALRQGNLPDIDLERSLPSYAYLLELRDTISLAQRRAGDAKSQLTRLGFSVD